MKSGRRGSLEKRETRLRRGEASKNKLWQSHGRSIEDPVFDYQDGLDEHGFKPGE